MGDVRDNATEISDICQLEFIWVGQWNM